MGRWQGEVMDGRRVREERPRRGVTPSAHVSSAKVAPVPPEDLSLVGKPSPPPPRRGPLAWLGKHELGLILALLAISGAAWALVHLIDAVIIEQGTQQLDERIIVGLRNPSNLADPIGPPWLEEMGRDLTALGGVVVQLLLVLAVGGYLLLRRAYRALLFMLVAIGGGLLVSLVAKGMFARPRPELVPHGSLVYTSSFPSGHSMTSTITYLTLAVLLARIESENRVKAFLLMNAALFTILVGASRVYLGVHWPTDVLAGWCMGLIWALLCWLVMRALQRKGNVEAAKTEIPELKAHGPRL